MKSVRNHTIAAFSLTLLLGAGIAYADGGAQERAAHRMQVRHAQVNVDEAGKARPILSGPKVEEAAKSRAEVTRMGEQRRPAQGQAMQPLMWTRVIRSLDLTEEQIEKIDELADAHRKAMRAFQAEHREEFLALQSQMREARQGQDREGMQAAMGKLRELREQVPTHEGLQKSIWEVLTGEQREMLRQRIADRMKEREERMAERPIRARIGASSESMRGERGEVMRDRTQPRRPVAGERPGRVRGEGARGRGEAPQRPMRRGARQPD